MKITTTKALFFAVAISAAPSAVLAKDAAKDPAAQSSSRTVATTASDAAVTARVKTALLKDPEISGLKIDVDTKNGVVTLKGKVASDAQGIKALQVASTIEGVAKVVNQLEVAS